MIHPAALTAFVFWLLAAGVFLAWLAWDVKRTRDEQLVRKVKR